jgi:hypothetical protein
MYTRIKNDLDEGVGKIKWFAGLLSERVRIELTVFRLLYKSEELKKKRDVLLQKIGDEVYQMRNTEKGVYLNAEILASIKEIEALEPEIKENIERASEISRITA